MPRPPEARTKCSRKRANEHDADSGAHSAGSRHEHTANDKAISHSQNEPHHAASSGDGRAVLAIPEAVPTSTLTESGYAHRVGPNILSLEHWERLLHGELFATSSRVDWATLLRRTFDLDVRHCARCGGRLSIRAVVTEPDAIASILADLRRQRDSPAAA